MNTKSQALANVVVRMEAQIVLTLRECMRDCGTVEGLSDRTVYNAASVGRFAVRH